MIIGSPNDNECTRNAYAEDDIGGARVRRIFDRRHRDKAWSYSGFRVAVRRSRAIKWRFPQAGVPGGKAAGVEENATFHRTEKST
jgi:hypothetical protein